VHVDAYCSGLHLILQASSGVAVVGEDRGAVAQGGVTSPKQYPTKYRVINVLAAGHRAELDRESVVRKLPVAHHVVPP
jgi:hypothetical protein